MSLFICRDLLKKNILTSEDHNSIVGKLTSFFIDSNLLNSQEFLINLLDIINTRIKSDDYDNLDIDINNIIDYISRENIRLEHNETIIKILKNLLLIYLYKAIDDELKYFDKFIHSMTEKNKRQYLEIYISGLIVGKLNNFYDKLPSLNHLLDEVDEQIVSSFQSKITKRLPEFDGYKICELRQGSDYRIGTSHGECYGYTFAMIDPDISPYNTQKTTFSLTEKVHDYQINQLSRKLDQKTIKKTRLTINMFCPDSADRAEKALHIARQNINEGIYVDYTRKNKGHACFLRIKRNNDAEIIEYTDPNFGIYRFNSEFEFKKFYVKTSEFTKKYYAEDWRFVTFIKLTYDPENIVSESNTLKGMIRSILTGNKYTTQIVPYAIIGAVIGGVLGSIFLPIIGTAIGTIIGSTLGAAINTTIGAIMGIMISANVTIWMNIITTHVTIHEGLLVLPYMMLDLYCDIKDWWHNKFVSQPQQNDNGDSLHLEACDDAVNDEEDSTATITTKLDSPLLKTGDKGLEVCEEQVTKRSTFFAPADVGNDKQEPSCDNSMYAVGMRF